MAARLMAVCLCTSLGSFDPFAQAAPSGDGTSQRRQRLEAAWTLMHERQAANDAAACRAAADAVRTDMQQDWSPIALKVWVAQAGCQYRGPWAGKAPTLAEIDDFWGPMAAHFEGAPPAAEVATGAVAHVLLMHWMMLSESGHAAEAQTRQLRQVDRWLEAASATPPDGNAAEQLLQLGRRYYGARGYTAAMESLHQRYAVRLGAGHLATLALLRARIFNFRQLSRPSEALALTDEFAALVATHHPGHERLAMGNRSERVGALSGVGRYADALNEGQLLLAWLQKQQPVQHANIMRSAYNLASLCMELADYEAAEQYAKLSVETGAQAVDLSDRAEVPFAAALAAQARMLRGDPGGPQELKRALAALSTYDLAVTDAFFTLVQQAGRQGDADVQVWAHGQFERLIASNTTPLQPERALLLLLQSVAHAAGQAQGVQDASEALAYGLVWRDLPLAALSHFALARHVAARQREGGIWLYKRGAQVLRTLREGLPEAAQGVQKAWLAAYEDDLRNFIGLLIDSGRLAEAEQAIEVLRDEELQDFRRRSRGAAVRLGPVEGGLRRQGMDTLSFTPDEQQRNQELLPAETQMRAASEAANGRSDRLDSWREHRQHADVAAQAAVQETSRAITAVAMRPAARDDAARAGQIEISERSKRAWPTGVARVSYFVRDAAVEVVLQSGPVRRRIRLQTGATDINRAVQALRAEFGKPGAGVPPSAQHLHRLLVAPLQGHLAGVHHLHLAPDGALRYVPFAALHDGRRYLAQRFSVSIELGRLQELPAATVAPAAGRSPRPLLAAFGRTQSDARHSALPGVEEELAVLAALRGARVQRALDAQFSMRSLAEGLMQQPQVVHLASHFVLDAAGEEASYLLLGDGTRLPLRALRELPWAGVQLALLSACDSGLALEGTAPGPAGTQGRALAGFAATLHAAGVKNVMATLWRIDDASTVQWMRAFYAPWRSSRSHPSFTAQHLARVQRQWLRQHAGTPLAHPYHWAAFSWMGAPR